jgi:Rrf2 family transcriptional regulator, cysteine metabolism repressor
MMFSTKAEYGVRVMVELARRASEAAAGDDGEDGETGGDPVIPLAEIAEHDGMPLAYLEHLVARLRKAGLLDSRRGSRGGYMLARPADQITMAEVVEALEGTIAPIECISQGPDGSIVCSRESDSAHVCPTKLLWTRVRLAIVTTLVQTTLADLLDPAAADEQDPLAALSALTEAASLLPIADAETSTPGAATDPPPPLSGAPLAPPSRRSPATV